MIEHLAVISIRAVSGFFRVLAWRGCRFAPTCSEYAVSAFHGFSWPKAVLLSVKRVARCHPFCDGGYDPLPEKEK